MSNIFSALLLLFPRAILYPSAYVQVMVTSDLNFILHCMQSVKPHFAATGFLFPRGGHTDCAHCAIAKKKG